MKRQSAYWEKRKELEDRLSRFERQRDDSIEDAKTNPSFDKVVAVDEEMIRAIQDEIKALPLPPPVPFILSVTE